MTNDDLEFSISQYVDGVLSEPDRLSLESWLKDDAGAQALLADYRKLNQMIVSAPLPAIHWDRFAQSISAAIDSAEDARIGHAFRMPFWVRAAMPIALAASVLIMLGVGVRIAMRRSVNSPRQIVHLLSPSTPTASLQEIIVVGPPPDAVPTGPAEIEVAIGPSSAVKDEPMVVQYSDDVASRPSHVSIASGVVPEHDTAALSADMQ